MVRLFGDEMGAEFPCQICHARHPDPCSKHDYLDICADEHFSILRVYNLMFSNAIAGVLTQFP